MEMDDQVALFVVKQQSFEEILSIMTNIQINSFYDYICSSHHGCKCS
jgi:hypothetical protein